MEPSDSNSAETALHWFIRARAADFGNMERARLEAWLAADPRHRREFDLLDSVWQSCDVLAEHLPALRPSAQPQQNNSPRWSFSIQWSAALAGLALAVSFFFSWPAEIIQQETAPGQHRTLAINDHLEVALDADSAVRITKSRPVRVELLRGEAYFSVSNSAANTLEVEVNGIRIKDIGTRFSVKNHLNGGRVSVAEGLVEVQLASGPYTVSAGRRIDFDKIRVGADTLLSVTDVAPWRNGQWHFSGAPLSEVAEQMMRQQGIHLEIADPKIAALTVSGNFNIAEADKVLWAITQVHGLNAIPLGGREFALRRR